MVRTEQLGQGGVLCTPAVEVGANGDDHGHARCVVVGGLGQRREEPRPLRLVGAGGEDLLELVDHDERTPVGPERVTEGTERGAGTRGERFGQRRRKRSVELAHGVFAGPHECDDPPVAPRETPRCDRRDQSGADRRGLTAPGRSDDAEE